MEELDAVCEHTLILDTFTPRELIVIGWYTVAFLL